jgi:kumamolisin
MACMPEHSRKPLPGSHRDAPAHDRIGNVNPETRATVTVYLRGTEPSPGLLSREEYRAAHGAAAEDVQAVRQFAAEHGLSVGDVDLARRSIELSGPVSAVASAFEATVGLYRSPDGGTYRGRVGALTLPAELDGVITGVFGIDERPQAQPHFRFRPRVTLAPHSTQYTPLQVATAYSFPKGLTGSGQSVAIIELGPCGERTYR